MELLSNNTTIIVETDSNHLPGTIVTNLILGAYPTKTKLENLQHVGFSWDTTGKYHQQKLTKSRNKNLQYTNNSLKKSTAGRCSTSQPRDYRFESCYPSTKIIKKIYQHKYTVF
eukprot:TRINITY_DN29814_c0_g1_i2.p1 TRINITY_DN29814_c0_g1~~TRINITY_DN29814_c0_g1_i2.p1  ORF type:complete len:114 (-),score=4.63 TRINITY_DN29814_c0_g1_i2:1512-1853(-)